MRKLFWLGIAALMAYRGGRGLSREAQEGVRRAPRISTGEILSLAMMPKWLRPVMLARAVAPAFRRSKR